MLIKDIRQHLRECHYDPEYCPICGKIFEGSKCGEELKQHLRQQSCERVSLTGRWHGITSDQQKRLTVRKSPKDTLETYWMIVYTMLFADQPLPDDPCK